MPEPRAEEEAVPKNVVVCCDGTANEFTRDRTSVVKLFLMLIKDPIVRPPIIIRA